MYICVHAINTGYDTKYVLSTFYACFQDSKYDYIDI